MTSNLLSNIKTKPIINNILLLIYLLIYNYFLFYNNENSASTFVILSIFSYLFLIVVNNINRLIYKLSIILFCITGLLYYIILDLFGIPKEEHYAAFYLTNYAELKSYTSLVPIKTIAKSLLLFLPLLFFLNAKLGKIKKVYIYSYLIILISFTLFKTFYNFSYLQTNPKTAFRIIYVSPFRILTNTIINFNSIRNHLALQQKLQKLPHNWKTTSKTDDEEEDLIVFVIGESVRKDYMGIYNNEIKNTPFLDSVNKIQFDNVTSYAHQTIESLTHAFILEDEKGVPYFPNNIINLAKVSGYTTYWISNQGSVGSYDNVTAALAKQANHFKFITNGHYQSYKQDYELLPFFKNYLNKIQNKKSAFFIHTIGSHPNPCDIIDNKFEYFAVSENISCYIESIRKTDKILEDIYKELLKKKKKFKIIYFSDHGLKITEEKVLLHNADYQENYDIPLIIIDSELNKNIHIKARRNLKDFLLLYEEIMDIETHQIKNNYIFNSEEKDNNADKLYNGLNYKKLKNNPAQY